MVLGGWSVKCANGGWFDTRCEKPIKITAPFSLYENHYVVKQAAKECKVLLNLVHIMYPYIAYPGLWMLNILSWSTMQVIELRGGQ